MVSFLGELQGEVAGEGGEKSVILEYGDGELAAGDGIATSLGGVLAGDGHLARESLDLHGLEGAEGGAVVGSHDRVKLALRAGEDVLHHFLGVGGIPVLHALLEHHFEVSLVDEGFEDFHLAGAEEGGVVVGGASAEEDDVALGRLLHGGEDTLGLVAADVHVVEGHVGGDVGGLDQAVVGYDLDAFLGDFVHRGGEGISVLGDGDDDLGALGDHVLDLVVLELGVMVGFLHEDVVAGVLEDLGHVVTLARPALGREIGEGKADLGLGGRAAGNDQACDGHDRYGDEQCFLQTGPPEKRYNVYAGTVPNV